MQVCDVEKQARDSKVATVTLTVGEQNDLDHPLHALTAELCEECIAAIDEYGLVDGIVRRAAAAAPKRRRRGGKGGSSSEEAPTDG